MDEVNSNIAYEYIRKRILSGEYRPGYALTTQQLANELRISRTPIRDALGKLESDGLVILQPRMGARVKGMDVTEFREMCQLRLALESHAAGLAALNRTEADLSEMRSSLESLGRVIESIRTAFTETSMDEGVREDVRFHIALIAAAKNAMMKKEILRLHLVNRVVSYALVGKTASNNLPGKESILKHDIATLAEHTEIFNAIERRDETTAKNAMERHIKDIINVNFRKFEQAQNAVSAHKTPADEMIYNV